jgi:hypothetical protein
MPADSAFPALGTLVAGLTEVAYQEGVAAEIVDVTQLEFAMPIELAVDVSGAAMTVRASPPTQTIRTSVMPVFHGLFLRLAVDPHD